MNNELPRDNNTLPKVIRHNAHYRADIIAWREKEFGIWQQWTWAEVLARVTEYASGMAKAGIARHDRVAIICGNRPQSYWSIVALQTLGAIPVPQYHDAVAEELAWVLDFAEVTAAIVENQEQCDKVLLAQQSNPRIRNIFYDDEKGMEGYSDGLQLCSLEHLRDVGKLELVDHPELVNDGISRGSADDIAIIPFTSGTTGKAKGVMLTHANVLEAARMGIDFDKVTVKDSMMSYLPIAWVGDFIFSLCMASVAGFSVNCPESEETFLHDMNEIGPTLFFAPPRVLEGLYARMTVRMTEASALKRALYNWGVSVATRIGSRIYGREKVGVLDHVQHFFASALVTAPLLNRTGFRHIRVAYTGGEAIGVDVFQFYRGIGMNLKQLYGATEASVFITQQPDEEVSLDTVGKPLPGIDVKIADSGEVLITSPGVFRGYLKDDAETASVRTEDGWLKTGDAGYIDDRGHLRIIDRAKDVGKLDSGLLFAPRFVENAAKFSPFISEVVSFGHARPHVVAIVNIDFEVIGTWAEQKKLAYSGYRDLALHPEVASLIAAEIATANQRIGNDKTMHGCVITRFVVLHKALDADDGELTRTRKLRRTTITERYQPVIDALYDLQVADVHCVASITFEDGKTGTSEATLKIWDVPPGAGTR
ncbi:MAG: AMP-binding protein [Alphaproteobacteria bacterium]|nr:AMP-binding protein [Alphaproteobacteria bacterium]